MRFSTEDEAIRFIFADYRRAEAEEPELDEIARTLTPTRNLIQSAGLLGRKREYAVVTGSKGKSSTSVITAKLLRSLGHRVGTLTSPHLVSWFERVRVNGTAISSDDFVRIVSEIAPLIEDVRADLLASQYLSPQGIFLAIALRYFDEQDVEVAVLEVGRGGRFDDVSLVPNQVAIFTRIIEEHTQFMGSLERIAWHKAGIIKPGAQAVSVPQAKEVLDILQKEAEVQNATFTWLSPQDMGKFVRDTKDGFVMRLHRYGEIEIPLMGHYQIENITLAVQAAGVIHSRLAGIPHGAPEYVARIREGLESLHWFGRVQQIAENPAIFVDGATNVSSVETFIDSVRSRFTEPRVVIVGVPVDRDYEGVYRTLAEIADTMILTASDKNPATHFPNPEDALQTARKYLQDVQYAGDLREALNVAKESAGVNGTILLAVAQILVAEAMVLFGIDTNSI